MENRSTAKGTHPTELTAIFIFPTQTHKRKSSGFVCTVSLLFFLFFRWFLRKFYRFVYENIRDFCSCWIQNEIYVEFHIQWQGMDAEISRACVDNYICIHIMALIKWCLCGCMLLLFVGTCMLRETTDFATTRRKEWTWNLWSNVYTHTHTHKYYDYDDDPVREKEKGRETNHKMLDRVSSLSLSRSRSWIIYIMWRVESPWGSSSSVWNPTSSPCSYEEKLLQLDFFFLSLRWS